MTNKIMWLVVSCLMVFALLLASCVPAVTKKTEVTPPTTEVTPATKEVAPAEKAGMVKLSLKKLDGTPLEKWAEAPRYGGTVIVVQDRADVAWDDFFRPASGTTRLEFAVSELLQGDWTRGPAGTAETAWWGRSFYLPFETGDLAASWEIPDPETIIYHIRKGVHWQDKPPVNGRELTATDVAFELMRKYANPKSDPGKKVGPGQWFISATAVDKYTVVVKGKEQKIGIAIAFEEISDKHYFLPPEVTEKGPVTDWRNVVGSGPFLVVDVIEDSSATFKRNPNYWKKDPLFPENQLPYVDTVKVLLITDKSTQYAGLRAGKIDYVGGRNRVPREDAESLLKTNPELMWGKEVATQTEGVLFGRVDRKPFNDIRIRRALAMAIDRPAILRDYYQGNAQLPAYPVIDIPEFKGAYTPLAELPESSRELYEYHPDKAKQLLAEVGYPNGFKFSAVLSAEHADIAQIYKAYLAKVGVDMELDLRESALYIAMVDGWPKTYKEAAFGSPTHAKIYSGTYLYPGANGNVPAVDDPFINETRLKMTSFELMQNQAELDRLAKKLALYIISQAYVIEPPLPNTYEMWQPWVKNFYGMNMGTNDRHGGVEFLWIDQGLKKKMGK